jgi:transposase
LRLTYEHGLSVRAISERLQLSKTSVATYLLRAREAGLCCPLPPIYDREAALQPSLRQGGLRRARTLRSGSYQSQRTD